VGYLASCALSSAGAVYCWGYNGYGELGNNSTSNSSVPVTVTTAGTPMAGATITQVSVGDYFACALSSAGAVYCWGYNGNNGLGNNSTTNSSVPVAVTTAGTPIAGKTIVAVSAGQYFACAVDSAGVAYCWGYNGNGELGNNSTANSGVPVAVATAGTPMAGRTIVAVSAGGLSTCALDSAGLVYCWGYGQFGLGNGLTGESLVPVAVTTAGTPMAGKTIAAVSSGNDFACAVDSAGLAYCWGENSNGQLGNNSTTSSTVPVAVTTSGTPMAGRTITQVSAGTSFTCAVDSAGVAYCWGYGDYGQLGNGSVTQSNVDVFVAPQGPTGLTASAGYATGVISWSAPAFVNNGTISGYTVSASPGNATCSTTSATSCTLTGLAEGITYAVTVTVTATTGSATSLPVTVESLAGVLSIAVPSSATLPTTVDGHTTSLQLGTVTVTDNRALGSASWTAMVSSTSFTTGAGGTGQVIPASSVTYWSGPATATSGSGTFTPGQAAAVNAVSLSNSRTAFSLSGGGGVNSASWNPTISVSVPTSVTAGTYTATITQSVA
jgi:alpha-tubulin suppressor-like RCC1 family protein